MGEVLPTVLAGIARLLRADLQPSAETVAWDRLSPETRAELAGRSIGGR